MKRPFRIVVVISLLVMATTCLTLARAAEEKEEKKTGWFDTAELGYTLTTGNAETATFSFANTLTRLWENAKFDFKLGGLRAETTTVTRIAIGPDDSNFVESKSEDTSVNAEKYFAEAEYFRQIRERLYWNAGARWGRNRDAGIENRYSAYAGVGNLWWDRDDLKFNTSYNLSYTDQEDVIDDPTTEDSFPGFRLSWAYLNKFGQSTEYTQDFTINVSLDELDDYFWNMTNAVAVNMSKKLALKVSLLWLYNNIPALTTVDRFVAPPGPGDTPDGTVEVELDKLDTIFTVALVVNF
jgi:hypothetical protein